MTKNYETEILTNSQAIQFADLFQEEVGTETELTEHDNGLSVTCFELTEREVETCRFIEEVVTKQ